MGVPQCTLWEPGTPTTHRTEAAPKSAIQPFPVLASAEVIVNLVPRLSLGIDDTATEQTEAHDEGVFGNTNSCTAQRWKSYARTLAVGLDAVAFTVRMASKLDKEVKHLQ